MNIFLNKYGTDTTTNFQLMRWANELNISPFYYCMRDEINDLKYKKESTEEIMNKPIKCSTFQIQLPGQEFCGQLSLWVLYQLDENFKVTDIKSPENDNDAVHKKYLREQINSIKVNKNHLEDKISNVKRLFKRQLNNKNVINDTKLQQEVAETKKPNTTAWINKAKPYFVDQIGDTLQGDLDMNNFKVTNLKSPENDNDAVHKKYLREQINSIEVNKNHLEDKINKTQELHLIVNLTLVKFFSINGTENVETKKYEINDENSKFNHFYEIRTSGKYIDRFRMLIIPDKKNDTLSLSEFDMILETETSPSMNIIRNPKPQKVEGRPISYQFLRVTDFEYVKIYFVNSSFLHEHGIISSTNLFTSVNIHKSHRDKQFITLQQMQKNME
ncbi:hypothetical protein LOTGIDRAFT_157535 [Lottia gigantea]|uniref:Uncharacterized protein n=1 Tax=Lottia gigantea TaxID=225164 RepID=V4B5P1_LOTGI|nr:hypothetical protein LOTGIDRAFT_157535 [Lottia gigantea]ESP01357.1 hypothetical protein LOTGIDRAFT_157535 [Lottia gigantea]